MFMIQWLPRPNNERRRKGHVVRAGDSLTPKSAGALSFPSDAAEGKTGYILTTFERAGAVAP
jgi:hypothetical protein